MFGGYDKIRDRAKKDGEHSRLMSEPGVDPVVGGVYTISPDFVCGDRSYTTNFIEVLAIAGSAALVKVHEGFSDKPTLMPISERYWYDASDAFEVYKSFAS